MEWVSSVVYLSIFDVSAEYFQKRNQMQANYIYFVFLLLYHFILFTYDVCMHYC